MADKELYNIDFTEEWRKSWIIIVTETFSLGLGVWVTVIIYRRVKIDMSAITRARKKRTSYLNFYFEGNELDDFKYFVQSHSSRRD